ncbi:hypothetical protein D6D02_06197 [Aureobasidium pullulans]|uniref:Uncharacterized protein n=1 Tax=Aureobasidium pullulans TaxID=5580 RepID=A0A4S8V2E6_AURPU|nr:hypothetical protein D6D24_10302 [Aureobasidium pullulans]THY10750.1 hypothetical protein D6D02_06197 [Aureobasidium pullulans]
MILDKVDLSHIASAFKLRGYSSCSPASLSIPTSKGPDAASRERDMFERAKQRRRADAEQARMKLAKKDARLRIRQFEDQRRKEDFEICTPKPSSETTEVDSGVFVFEDPKTTASNAEIVSKIVSKWRARARWSKALQKVRSMSSGSSNISPSGRPTLRQPDLLCPGTPTRTRASSTSSMMSPRTSDTPLLKYHTNDLLSPLTPRRARASSTDSVRLVVT